MLDSDSKLVKYFLNFLLLIWQLPQVLTGLIGLVIFHNFEIYTNKEAGIKVIKVNKGNFNGSACFSSGPIIFVTPNCSEETIKHETGHSVQSLLFGPIFHLVVSVPSICLYLYRHKHNKSKEWYYSHWPENDANKCGHVNTSK